MFSPESIFAPEQAASLSASHSFHIYIGALRPLSSNEAYKLEALSESYQRQVGTSIQRQQTSGLSTPLLSADRRRVYSLQMVVPRIETI